MTQFATTTTSNNLIPIPKYQLAIMSLFDSKDHLILDRNLKIIETTNSYITFTYIENFYLLLENKDTYPEIEVRKFTAKVYFNKQSIHKNELIDIVYTDNDNLGKEYINKMLPGFTNRLFFIPQKTILVRDLWISDELSHDDQNVYIGFDNAMMIFNGFNDNQLIITPTKLTKNPPYIAFKSDKQDNSQRYHSRLDFDRDFELTFNLTCDNFYYYIDPQTAKFTKYKAISLVDCNMESKFINENPHNHISVFDPEYLPKLHDNLTKTYSNLGELLPNPRLYYTIPD